jgi:quercetin dioxygenase-like cupin family protein
MAIEGGERHVMRKGDVVHISPDVPHQTLVASGKTFTYYVIKVEAPK